MLSPILWEVWNVKEDSVPQTQGKLAWCAKTRSWGMRGEVEEGLERATTLHPFRACFSESLLYTLKAGGEGWLTTEEL